MKNTIRLSVLGLLLFPFLETNAQVQTWIDYTTNNWINSNLLYYGDYGIRGAISIDEVLETGLTLDEIRTRSFAKILKDRRAKL